MSCNVSPESFDKTAFEKEIYSFDFSPIMSTSETIESSPAPSVTSEEIGGGTSDLTISSVTTSGQTITFFIAGGTHAKRYKINCQIYTSLGRQLELEGILRVWG